MPTDDKARQQWGRIVDNPDSAEKHAAILEARRLHARSDPPAYADMIRAYRRAMDHHVFAHLDRLPLTGGQLTYLDQIVTAATNGLPARRIPAEVRVALHAPMLIDCFDAAGVQAWPSDVTGTVHARVFGIAVIRAARTRPLPLSETLAAALAQLEADDGGQLWPGSVETQRIALHWGLVDRGEGRFLLTPAGGTALTEHRRNSPVDTIVPSQEQAQVLAYLSRLGRTGGDLRHHPRDKVVGCLNRQWIRRCGQVPHARRSLYRITESGRDALARRTMQQRRTAGGTGTVPSVAAPHLSEGMTVRLVNRKRAGVDARWVVVDRLEQVTNPGRNPTWKVWVRDPGGGDAYLYGGRAFHPATRYEIGGQSAAA